MCDRVINLKKLQTEAPIQWNQAAKREGLPNVKMQI